MVISHLGAGMVKIGQGETVVVFNPNGKTRFGSDLALISVNDKDYNAVESMSYGDRVPFAITGPGEYEVGGIFVKGFATAGASGKINTIYSIILDGINLVHLGALAEENISDKTVEELGVIDVLFVPAGSEGLLSTKAAAKLATKLEPRLIVPVDYSSDDKLTTFLKEVGADKAERVETLQLKRKDLLDKEGAVVVIKSY